MLRTLADALASIATELYQPVYPMIAPQALKEDSVLEGPLFASPEFTVEQFAAWVRRLKLLTPQLGQESLRSQL